MRRAPTKSGRAIVLSGNRDSLDDHLPPNKIVYAAIASGIRIAAIAIGGFILWLR